MFEETISVVSIWASMNSWLTPAVLFVVLNIMIGTIAVTSGLASAPKPPSPAGIPDPTRQHHHLTRSPSVLQRLRSINLYRSAQQPPSDPLFYHPADQTVPEPDPEPFAPTRGKEEPEEENAIEERDDEGEEAVNPGKEEEDEEGPTMEQVFSRIQQGPSVYGRSKSDGGEQLVQRKVRKRIIKKAASDISSVFGELETVDHAAAVEEDESEQTPVTEQIRRGAAPEEEEVDGKAEDFINRFHRQLKLQRLESLYGAGA